MKVAKLNSKSITTTIDGIKDDAIFLVPDNYSFTDNLTTDITLPNILQTFFNLNIIEYGVFRDSLKTIFIPLWETISFDEKKICVKHFCYPSDIGLEEWNSYYDDNENYYNWKELIKMSRDNVRLKRLFAAFEKLSYDFTQTQVAIIYMTSKPYCIDYWMANLPHLVLWITNGTLPALGIDFSLHGLAQQSGYTEAKRDALLDIIVNGNYS